MKASHCAIMAALVLLGVPKAEASEDARERYCTQSRDPWSAQRAIENSNHQLMFRNQGGFGGLGTCWWHSRFTRNASLLAVYRPDLPLPTLKQARAIIRALSRPRISPRVEVVEIPGYENLYHFSWDWQEEIQRRFNAWQLEEGILGLDVISRGIGASRRDPKRLEREMDALYARVQSGEIVYQKLQIRGVAAHAWLVTAMQPTEMGYTMTVIDSNFPGETLREEYIRGTRAIVRSSDDHSKQEVAPYTEFSWELDRMREARDRYCGE